MLSRNLLLPETERKIALAFYESWQSVCACVHVPVCVKSVSAGDIGKCRGLKEQQRSHAGSLTLCGTESKPGWLSWDV